MSEGRLELMREHQEVARKSKSGALPVGPVSERQVDLGAARAAR